MVVFLQVHWMGRFHLPRADRFVVGLLGSAYFHYIRKQCQWCTISFGYMWLLQGICLFYIHGQTNGVPIAEWDTCLGLLLLCVFPSSPNAAEEFATQWCRCSMSDLHIGVSTGKFLFKTLDAKACQMCLLHCPHLTW